MKKLFFLITKRCNLRCRHCFNDSGEAVSGEMSLELVYAAIDMASADGFTQVQLTGGEALVREDIFDIVRYVHGKHMIVFLQTNGVMDDERVSRALSLDPAMTRFIVSFDGIETNIKLRGLRATEASVRFIKTVAPRFYTRINTLLTAHTTMCEIDELLDFAAKSGASVAFNPIIPTGRGTAQDLMKLQEYFDFMVYLQGADNIRKGFEYDAKTGLFSDNEDCPVRRKSGVFLNTMGECYPCGFLEGVDGALLGNIFEAGGFNVLLDNYPANCAAINTSCALCEHYEAKRCFAGCPARIYAMRGDFAGEEYYCMKRYAEGGLVYAE